MPTLFYVWGGENSVVYDRAEAISQRFLVLGLWIFNFFKPMYVLMFQLTTIPLIRKICEIYYFLRYFVLILKTCLPVSFGSGVTSSCYLCKWRENLLQISGKFLRFCHQSRSSESASFSTFLTLFLDRVFTLLALKLSLLEMWAMFNYFWTHFKKACKSL